MADLATSTPPQLLHLVVQQDQHQVQVHTLREGASVMVGSGANCGIRLADSKIGSIHCVIQLQQGQLHLQDWCSALGTFVDDERVEEDWVVPLGHAIRIGNYTLVAQVDTPATSSGGTAGNKASCGGSSALSSGKITANAPAAPAPLQPATPPRPQSVLSQVSPVASSPTPETPLPRPGDESSAPHLAGPAHDTHLSSDPAVISSHPSGIRPIVAEVATPSTGTPPLAALTTPSSAPSTPPSSPAAKLKPATLTPPIPPAPATPRPRWDHVATSQAARNDWADDSVQLLQDEVALLQSELAERDRELVELRESLSDSSPSTNRHALDAQQTEALVSRLEQLLDELTRSDSRVQAIEELLRIEQERNQAESEEREQIATWLHDIEARVTAREEEWQAEKDVLLRHVNQLKCERDQLEQQLGAHCSGSADKGLSELVQSLRAELEQTRQRVEQAETSLAKSEEQLAIMRQQTPESLIRESVEEALRAERLQLAQERATLSRERSELARRTADATTSTPPRVHSDADARFLALRQTLKEIHDDPSPVPAKKTSLTARLADLWRRLDGPTDTD